MFSNNNNLFHLFLLKFKQRNFKGGAFSVHRHMSILFIRVAVRLMANQPKLNQMSVPGHL
jgi:hypothetical protein